MAAAGLLLLANVCSAQSWVGGSGSWSVPANWTGTAVPGTGGDVYLDISNTVVTLDVSSASLDSITIDATNGSTLLVQSTTLSSTTAIVGLSGSGSISQTGGLVTITGDNIYNPDLILGATTGGVGNYQISSGTLLVDNMTVGGGSTPGGTYGTGVFTQTGGLVDLTQTGSSGQLYVGDAAGSNGSYSLQAGSLKANYEFVGVQSSTLGAQVGQRSFTQSGGTNTIIGDLTIATNSGATASYNLSGGANSQLTAADEFIGSSGIGSFTQSGGVNNVSGYVVLGYAAGSNGNYSLLSGSVGGAYELIGNVGTGAFTQLGGVNQASQTIDVVNGIYSISSGTLSALSAVIGDADTGNTPHTGTFIQTGGLVTITGNNIYNPDLILGATTGAVGNYQISSGTLLVDNMTVGGGSTPGGTYGTGGFTQTGGLVDLTQTGSSGQLYIGDAAGSNGSYSLQGGLLKANYEYVGVQSSTLGAQVGQRSFVQSGGTNRIIGDLTVGYNAGATGGYNLTGGTNSSLIASDEFIGSSGAGSFTQSGGVNSISGYLVLAYAAGSTGNYSLISGSLGSAYELIGNTGVGSFSQLGGMNNATQAFDVVNGIYNMSSGTLTALSGVIGDSDTNNNPQQGNFVQTGGLVTITGSNPSTPDLVLGTTTGAQGSYQISSGTLLVDNLTVGSGSTGAGTYGTGVFTQIGGLVDLTHSGGSGQLYIGDAAGSNGSYTMQGGSLKANDEFVGVSSSTSGTQVGQRSFIQSGGTNTTGNLTLGNYSGATGAYTLSGGASSQLSAANEYIGSSGSGSFTQEGGVNSVSGFQILGYNSGGNGNYNLSGGSLTSAYELIGNAGTGIFNQSNGVNTITQALDVVNGAYSLTSGTLSTLSAIVGDSDTNNVSHSGTFTQSGGLVSVTGSDPSTPDIVLGTTTGAVGTYQISSGTLSVDNMAVGSGSTGAGTYGTGQFIQSGGVVDMIHSGLSGQLYVGDAAGSNGNYQLQGGSLTANSEFVGVSSSVSGAEVGQRDFVQSGGTNTITSNLTLGEYTGASGSYALSGGSNTLLTASTEYIGSAGSGNFTQDGGVNNTSYLLLGYTSPGGTGLYTMNNGSLTASYEAIGNSGSGTFNQNGGTNTVTQALLVYATGVYNLNGGNLVISGTGANTGLDNGGAFNMAGGTLSGTGQKLNEGAFSGYGTINGPGNLVNGTVNGNTVLSTGTMTFQNGLSSVNSNVVNNAGSSININAITVFAGSVTNNGVITTNHTTSFFFGPISGNGAFISDPSVIEIDGADTITDPGYISASAGDVYKFGNDVDITTQNSTQWKTSSAEMDITSGTYTSTTVLHSFVYSGQNLGASNAGYNNNFAWKTLSIEDNNYLVNSSGALYVTFLELGSAGDPSDVTSFVDNFTGSLLIYYDPSKPANAYLEDGTYDFGSGGGEILPIPEPSTLALFPVGLAMGVAFWHRRRKRARIV